MSVRSHQVQALSRELAYQTGVAVAVVYDGEHRYLVHPPSTAPVHTDLAG
jgi:hypothetical protein